MMLQIDLSKFSPQVRFKFLAKLSTLIGNEEFFNSLLMSQVPSIDKRSTLYKDMEEWQSALIELNKVLDNAMSISKKFEGKTRTHSNFRMNVYQLG